MSNALTSKTVTALFPPGNDSLLDALVALTRMHHKPYSADSLVAGLPLEHGKLTPALFIRAAERAGFTAKYLDRSLADIPDAVLPAALVLNDNEILILRSRDGDTAQVTSPRTPTDTEEMSLPDLATRYRGDCFYIKPDYEFEPPTASTAFDKHWFWKTISLSKAIYGEVLLASFLVNLFALVSPLFIMNVYDRVVPNYAVETLWVLASGVFIVYLFDLAVKSLRGYFIDVAGKRADILLSSQTFSRVLDIKMGARPARVGSFANNLQEFDGFREFFTSTTLIAVIDLPFVFLFILLILGIAGPLAWIPLLSMPLVIIVSLLLQRPLQSTIQKSFTESAKKHAMLIETLTALDAVKGARAEGVMQRRWEEYNSRLAKLGLKSRLLSLATVNIAGAVQQLATVAIVIAGVYAIMAGELTVGGLIACTILTGRCLAPMSQVAGILTRYHHSMAAYGAVDRLMGLPVERPEGRKFLHRPHLDGSVEFRKVTFAYPEQQQPALANISFRISAGEKIGIIGRMGSGKSTLGKLIMNFYQPKEGSILISSTDINQLDPIDLRRNINYVPQDVMLFNSTLRENIVIGSPLADDAEVLSAAELSGLTEYVNQHPQGFDQMISERGGNLSGGQRQAIGIARAFITHAPLVLLDEPTNSMDNTTETLFKNRLTDYVDGRTLILVTHKTSMLTLVNRLIVMNQGQIVADGPKADILRALSGGQA